MLAARRFAPLLLAGTISCAPLFEPAYGTTVQRTYECGQAFCYQARTLRTVREVREGDFVEGATPWSNVSYRGWVISRIGPGGVELKPSGASPEKVVMPYGRQESIQTDMPRPNERFMGSLVFERGDNPGTAVMTIIESP
jgi:hypothetical protein